MWCLTLLGNMLEPSQWLRGHHLVFTLVFILVFIHI